MKAIIYLEDGKSFNAQSSMDTERLGEVIINTAIYLNREEAKKRANVKQAEYILKFETFKLLLYSFFS